MTLPVPAEAVVDPRLGARGPALLALEDGSVFPGIAFAAAVAAGGDLVANTSQTGYQEVCTDPSYAGQVVVMTYPLIGNYGRMEGDDQSARPWLRALVVAHATAGVTGRARQLAHLLRESGVPAIAGVDTRAVARRLRETGTQRAIVTAPGEVDPDAAVAAARALPRWEDQDFVEHVSAPDPFEVPPASGTVAGTAPLVVVVDYGLKHNIVAALAARGARVRVLPHTSTAAQVLTDDVAGVVLSPGPGDPVRLAGPVGLAEAILAARRPLLGICLGHQLVGLAAGGRTTRLRFGHHGANHPVQDVDTGRVQVTAQNHEVQVLGDSLPAAGGFYVSQRNLNDGSVEGLRHREWPVETVQYHPEGSPGPLDALEVFDRFLAACRAAA
ncbi:MAG TPA: glutamine-hydrolyzing carbamoyl-phosphate synthase small subunit [Candidatus Baltobacteraceae bacterium]|nr:glutamine-hydrolyzing carbamoyl-phosphate synthase small subunit [Candidatus Baltobacteraceae bacterium]